MKTKVSKKPNKNLKKVGPVKEGNNVEKQEEVKNTPEVHGTLLKKPSHRAAKFQDSEYISELDRDFGFDLNQDPLSEEL